MSTTIDPRYHDGVIFDLDGVVTDTASLHRASWSTLFDEYLADRPAAEHEDHRPFSGEDYRQFVDGKPRGQGVNDFLVSRGISLHMGSSSDTTDATIGGLGNHKQRLFLGLLSDGAPVFASTVALVRKLQEIGIRTAVFSSSRNCERVLRTSGIGELFAIRVDGIVAAELGLAGKPDPAVLLETVRRLDVHPGRCVVIEDADAGVAAGRAGGFALVVGVDRTGHAEELLSHGADVVVTDLAEVTVRIGDQRMSELPNALDSDGQVIGLAANRRPAVFLDFDGTLSAIVGDPGAATLIAGAKEALSRLAALCPVAVLSGRDLADVRARIGLPNIWYAGSHGFELIGPDGRHHQNEDAAPSIPTLERAATELRSQLVDIAGLLIEHKRFGVAVHVRNVAPSRVDEVAAVVHALGTRHGLRTTTGRKVIELRPDIAWDKGQTLAWILEQSAEPNAVLPIYLGDDLTDEDAFDMIRTDGIGILVRHSEDGDRRSAARYAVESPEQVRELLVRLAQQIDAAQNMPADQWSLEFHGYEPGEEKLREALCTVGNGYLATRGCAPESPAGTAHYPGTYAAGVFNRLSDDMSGSTIDNESLVNLPNWLAMTFRIDGGAWFDIDATDVLSYRQSLDLHSAELTREFRFRDQAGRTSAVSQRRFAAMHLPHACALETTFIAENWSGTIEFRSVIDGGVQNALVERYRELSRDHLEIVQKRELSPDAVLLAVRTVQSQVVVTVAARTTVWRGASALPASYRIIQDGTLIGHDVAAELTAGESLTVEKIAVIFTGHDHAVSDPATAAERCLPGLGRYAQLRAGHALAWAALWERFGIDFDGHGAALRTVRLHTLHILQTVSPNTAEVDAGVPARGLHGEAYRGHVFWDELFIFPVLNLRMPAMTKSLLRYRFARLPEARRAAQLAGHCGAMFPWQSGSDGREESPRLHLNPRSGRWNPDPSARQHHIGAAIAYNAWQYYQVSGDLDYLIDCGAELLVEIARFWVSLTSYDDHRNRYVIRGVIGPDEFHSGYPGQPYDGVDNNAYTNVMAVWVIVRALDALNLLPLRQRLDLLEKLSLRGSELAHWDDVSRRMFVPFHDGVISQFEGYDDLAELDWMGYRQRYGNIQRLDRILEAENDDVNRYKASKQADALMLFYLLSADELRELLARTGYPFEPDQIPKTVQYYLARTSHGSTLSAVVHAWVLARANRELAIEFFEQVLKSDLEDIQGGTTSEGVHLAAMAGSIDLLQRCFTGLEMRSDRLVLAPLWSESPAVLAFPLHFRGHRLHLRVSGRGAEISAEPGNASLVDVECRGRIQQLSAGCTIRFP